MAVSGRLVDRPIRGGQSELTTVERSAVAVFPLSGSAPAPRRSNAHRKVIT